MTWLQILGAIMIAAAAIPVTIAVYLAFHDTGQHVRKLGNDQPGPRQPLPVTRYEHPYPPVPLPLRVPSWTPTATAWTPRGPLTARTAEPLADLTMPQMNPELTARFERLIGGTP